MPLTHLFDLAVSRGASDIHLAKGEAPRLRIDGKLVSIEGQTDLPEDFDSLLTADVQSRIGSGQPFERTILHGDVAFFAIFFRVGEGGWAATFRVLAHAIPPLDVIGEDALPVFRKAMEARSGLVLIAGRTGSGKWTTASSLTDAINGEKPARILVVEGHPNYRFTSKESLVTQLHVGQDCDTYERALEIAGQADFDVVALDDIPTYEALRKALILASTGRLVIANLHAESVAGAIAGLLATAGPDEAALREALAENLILATAQRLLPGIDGRGRVPVYEWITNSEPIRAALRNGDLGSAQAGDPGSRSLREAFEALIEAGKIDRS